MNYNDVVGTLGVGLILLAYFLSTAKLIRHAGRRFYAMNILGAALACYASYLIHYKPFIVLEACWTLVSVYGLAKALGYKMI